MINIFLKIVTSTVFLTTFSTVFSGVLVFIMGQFIMEYIINPLKRYRALRERIICTLNMYSNYYHNPYDFLNCDMNVRDVSEYNDASREIRLIACELAAYIGTIPKFKKNKIKNLNEVKSSLIGISNGFHIRSDCDDLIEYNCKLEKRIQELLKFDSNS